MADLHTLQLEWFDAHLRGSDLPDDASARAFFTGAGGWERFTAWPPSGTRRTWDLGANGRLGDGAPGDVRIAADTEPAPALGGRSYPWEPTLRPGAFDHREYSRRPDVAVFEGYPLADPLVVAGPAAVELELQTESETAGTDVVATLLDIGPDGTSWNVTDGIRRVEAGPGASSRVSVAMGDLAHVFDRGHHVGLALAAAAFPRFDYYGGPGDRVIATGSGRSRLVMEVMS